MNKEYNQELNEILFLMKDYYEHKKIDDTDLEKIKNWADQLKTGTTIKNMDSPLPPDKKDKYKRKFNRYFYFNNQLNREFKINATEIDLKKDLVIDFIVFEKNLELATEIKNKVNIMRNQKWQELPGKLTDYKDEFNKTLGKEIDKNLSNADPEIKGGNTRRITVDYQTNFGNLTENDVLTFFPVIIESKNIRNNFFSLVVSVQNSLLKSDKGSYDYFKMCPPETGC